MMDNVTVVVRTVDERTRDICCEILEKIYAAENIFIVQNVTPFAEAIKKAFLIGINQRKKWTLVVDADILISEKNIKYLLDIGEYLLTRDKTFFSLDGMVYDKFWMENRVGGPHLYNTGVVPKALRYIQSSQKDIRPETYIKKKMQKHGYNFYVCSLCVGIHDFFQDYTSIFRKGILHAKKHKGIETYLKRWNEVEEDKDFKWLCEGINYGNKKEDIQVDYELFEKIIHNMNLEFDQQNDEIDMNEVKVVLEEYVEDKNKVDYYRPMSIENRVRREIGITERKHEILMKSIRGGE